MVKGGQVSTDASSVDSFKSNYNSIVEGISSWTGSSKDNFIKQTNEFVSYFDKVKSQMDTFSQACTKYEAYTNLKKQLKQAELKLKLAEASELEADINYWSDQVNTIKDKLEKMKNEINALLQSAAGVSLSATSGSYDVKVSLNNNSSDKNKNKSSVTSTTSSDKNKNESSVTGTTSSNNSYNQSAVISNTSYYNGSGYSSATSNNSSYNSGTSTTNNTVNTNSTKTKKSTTTSGIKVNVGDLDMTNYPRGDSLEDGKERAVLVAKYLMKHGGFTAEQAAAMVGVYLDENNCDPGEVMEAEKNGQGAAGTGGNGYGAGIASWTFEESKRQSLSDAGIDPNTPIENLTLEQQCDVIIAESQKSNKKYYDALRRCETLEDASATAVVITGGVGFSNNWDTHPTPAEAKALSDYYGSANDASFGASDYHWNLDQRRLEYAKEIYKRL